MPSRSFRAGATLLALAAVVSLSLLNRPAPSARPSVHPSGSARSTPATPPFPAVDRRSSPVANVATLAEAHTPALQQLGYAQRWTGALPPALAAFRAWTQRYTAAPDAAARFALEPEGLALARARRPEMRRLIIADPELALAITVPAALRQALPPAIVAELETRHAGRGDFALLASTPAPGEPAPPPLRRIVYLDGVTFNARAYGRRESQLTKENASLHGIALDEEFALHESPVRALEPGEIPATVAEPVCAACAGSLPADDTSTGVNVAEVEYLLADGRLWRVHPAELESFTARALAAEDQPGPRVAPLSAAAPLNSGGSDAPARAADAATPHTIGTKQLLVIRVDTSDFPGEPLSQAAAQAVVENNVKPMFEDMSYGQTTLVTTVTSQLYRLPRTGASYATVNDDTAMHTDARNLAAADYTIGNYDRIIVLFPNLGAARVPGSRFTFAGRGAVSGTNIWINGPTGFVFPTVTHELGHSYGLLHANLWRVTDGNPLSAGGNTLEYGDPFDMMGSSSVTAVTRDNRHHFNMWGKNRLGWLPDDAVLTATRSGTYRIHRFDARAAPRTQPQALRIFRDGVRWYWIGLRQNFSSGTPRADGAYIIWGHNQRLQTQLLDLNTPGAPTGTANGNAHGAADAVLALGSTFNDPRYGVTIRPIARGGDEPSQWLDVEVTLAPAPPNVVTAWGREGSTFYDTETGEDLVPAPETNVPMDLTGVQAIAAGDTHALALKHDGTVVAWGRHTSGQIAVPSGLANVVAIAAGGHVSGAVLADGTVRLWGDPASGILTPPADLRDVRQLAIGSSTALGIYHALALRADGTIVGWGDNTRGQITTPSTVTRATAIAASDRLSIALRPDGTVVRWGTTFTGALPFPTGLSDVVAIASSGNAAHALALKRDGTVVGWGVNNDNRATPPAGLTDVVALATGAAHSLALKRDGSIVAWGNSALRRTGLPPSLPRATAIAASGGASFALTGTGLQIDTQPQPQTIALGGTATFSIDVAGASGPVTYQWRKDGVALAGATGRTLTLSAATAAQSGNYDVVVTASGIAHTSAAARLAVGAAPAPVAVARIANLSIRTAAGTGDNTLIVGVGIGGANTSGTKAMLIRGVGPTLAAFGLTGTLADPIMTAFQGQTQIAQNDDWAGGFDFASLGAFAFSGATPRDAAIYNPAAATGSYSIQIAGKNNATGIALAEIYDATPSASFTTATPRLVNVSARTQVGTGDNILIAGFVIAGPGAKNLLIRGIGPTLGLFGVQGTLANPRLELFDSAQVRIRENDDWGGGSALTAAFTSVGAFQLESGSRDAALLAELQPGSYTVQVSGVNNATGVALVEIYDLP